ncbi:MAG: hypothetical protein J2P37_05510, partial [Ktedonobacteraceae bacterium]|nr:hypothetical protein [Ktedonobacteraceae bacterium]
ALQADATRHQTRHNPSHLSLPSINDGPLVQTANDESLVQTPNAARAATNGVRQMLGKVVASQADPKLHSG